MRGDPLSRWSGYLGRYPTQGTRHTPEDALGVLRCVEDAARDGHKIRAVGGRHSSSDVAKPADGEHWIDLANLRSTDAALEWPHYRSGLDRARYVRLGAGTTIAEANALLASERPPRALYNMGNYDGQTLAGAFSTGTHGSGLRHAPICDRVAAIEVVTDEHVDGQRWQRLLRIEPEDGVTDSHRFEAARGDYDGPDRSIRRMELEQDDETFRAALLNLGCFGVIVAVTFEVRGGFWLEEVETLETWKTISIPKMAEASPEFLQLTLVPHRVRKKDDHDYDQHDDPDERYDREVVYLRTTRWEIPARDHPPERQRFLEDLARALGATDTGILENIGLKNPPAAVRRVLGAFAKRARSEPDGEGNRFRSRSDLVHINSLGPHVKATSADIWVPLDKADDAVDRIVALAEARTHEPGADWAAEGWYHTSPVGIRVVGASRALIAPSFDGPRVSLELPLLVDVSESDRTRRKHDRFRARMLETLEKVLCADDIGGRPHWGQRNLMTDARAAAMYGDRWTRWKEVYRRFNRYGTFDNRLTHRMGLSGAA